MSNINVKKSNGLILQEFIICTPSLKRLELSGNINVCDIGACHIGRALELNSTLEELCLSNCGPGLSPVRFAEEAVLCSLGLSLNVILILLCK